MNYTPYSRLSKKERRAMDNKKRVNWSINPVTRKPKNPRAYDRARTRNEERKSFSTGSFLLLQEDHDSRPHY